MSLLSVRREVGEFKKRYKWMALFVLLVFGGLFGRMIQLQILEYDHYAGIARENITRTITLPATRGIIRDHAGRVVAKNRPAYNVYLTPSQIRPDDVPMISELMGFDDEGEQQLRERLLGVPERRRAHQIRFYSDISRDQLAALSTHSSDLPGMDLISEPVRMYPFGTLGAHAIGYLNEMTAEELDRLRTDGYRLGDRVGRSGLERAWESYLRGRRGYRRILVDVRDQRVDGATDGRPMRREPVPGRDLSLTLDMELMRIAERAFRGHPAGAVVVVDVRTGAIRALFSKPSYDLNELIAGLSHERYAELSGNPFRPLIDKTLFESYFPGSTFKPFSAIAALQNNILNTGDRFNCPGYYELGRTRFRCNVASGHGEINMRQAMVQSCNVYFYELAEQVGLDRLAHVASDFGLGRRTGAGINSEAAGFIPTRAWYEQHGGRRFRLGFTINTAIGQGDTKITLIQLAMAYAAIANGGTLYVPQLVSQVTAPDGSVIEEFQPRVRRRVHVDPDHLAMLHDSLFGVVNDQEGTAHEASLQVGGDIPIAGKTGTAQVSQRVRHDVDPAVQGYYRRAHSWFAGFAPADEPRYAIAVMIEHGGAGGRYAAPIGIRVLREYLSGGAQARAGGWRPTYASFAAALAEAERAEGGAP